LSADRLDQIGAEARAGSRYHWRLPAHGEHLRFQYRSVAPVRGVFNDIRQEQTFAKATLRARFGPIAAAARVKARGERLDRGKTGRSVAAIMDQEEHVIQMTRKVIPTAKFHAYDLVDGRIGWAVTTIAFR
jgi:hypothetical protein